MNQIFEVKVLNWNEHNPGRKKSFKKTLIANSFCHDAKVNALPINVRWMFLALLLMCGECNQDTVTFTSAQGNSLLRDTSLTRQGRVRSTLGVSQALHLLKSFQLVTFEILSFLEVKRSEEKGNEIKRSSARVAKVKKDASQPTESAAPAIAFYCDFWRARYKSERSPTIMPAHAKLIKNLVVQVGSEKAKLIIEAYLKMPDSWFVTKRHDIPTLLGNLNSVTQFMDSGKIFTKNEIRNLDVSVTNEQTLDALRRGEI